MSAQFKPSPEIIALANGLMSLDDEFDDLFSDAFRARFKGLIQDWAREQIRLSTKESAEFSGQYDPELNPLPLIVFDFFLDPEFDELFVMKSSQSGFTLAALILICFYVAHYQRNIIYAIDSVPEVRRISTERLQPMLEACLAAAANITADKDDMTNLTMSLKHQTIYLGGAGSVGANANKSVGLAIVDETDTFKMSEARTESHPALLIADRLKRVFTDSFFMALSKPDQWDSFINQNYLTGTRHHCFVPCPHEGCGHMQTITWEHMRFEHCKTDGAWDHERVLRETFLECEACKQPIYEHHKPEMIRHREWRRTNMGQDKHKPKPRRASVHVSDLYSTFPTVAWGVLAVKWLEAQGDSDKLDNMRRSHFGLPVRRKAVQVEEQHLTAMIGSYKAGHCPFYPDIITLASDRQADVYKAGRVAWSLERNEGWLIDYQQTISERDVVAYADTPVMVDDWGDIPVERRTNPVVMTGCIDEGYNTFTIRAFCLSTQFELGGQSFMRFYPCRGAASAGADMMKEETFYTADQRPVPVIVFKDDAFKTLLYEEAIEQRAQLIVKRHKGEPTVAPLLHLYEGVDPSFLQELCQERRIPIIRNHEYHMVWGEPKGKNDWGDMMKMNLVAFLKAKPMLTALKRLRDQGLL